MLSRCEVEESDEERVRGTSLPGDTQACSKGLWNGTRRWLGPEVGIATAWISIDDTISDTPLILWI